MAKKKKNKKNKKKVIDEKDFEKVVEVEARTVKDAIEEALELLEAGENEVQIEVLKEEHKGLFGMEGPRLAKVRAGLKYKEN
jgi:predicted RNA-binding protein Jag